MLLYEKLLRDNKAPAKIKAVYRLNKRQYGLLVNEEDKFDTLLELNVREAVFSPAITINQGPAG